MTGIPAAVIFAGGLGSRLAPYTDDLPKPLVIAANRVAISYTMQLLAQHLIEDVAVIYRDPRIRLVLERLWGDRFRFVWLAERNRVGTGGALRSVPHEFRERDLVLLTADMVNTVDLTAALSSHRGSNAHVSIATASAPADLWEGDVLTTDSQSRVNSYGPPHKFGLAGETVQGSTGIQIVSPGPFWNLIPLDGFVHLSQDLLPAAIASKLDVFAFAAEHFPWDFGYPEEILAGMRRLLQGDFAPLFSFGDATTVRIAATANVHESVFLSGPLVVGAGAVIERGCRIHGPSSIGQGSHLGQDVHIDCSVVMAGSIVPAGTSLVSGILGQPSKQWAIIDEISRGHPEDLMNWPEGKALPASDSGGSH